MTIAQNPSFAARARFGFRFLARAGDLYRWADRAYARYRTRRHLMELSDDMLKDIGLSRSQAFEEGSKPFWR